VYLPPKTMQSKAFPWEPGHFITVPGEHFTKFFNEVVPSSTKKISFLPKRRETLSRTHSDTYQKTLPSFYTYFLTETLPAIRDTYRILKRNSFVGDE